MGVVPQVFQVARTCGSKKQAPENGGICAERARQEWRSNGKCRSAAAKS
jgi:hypothetical protein